MLAVVAALLAATCFAASTVTQHRAASTAPDSSGTGVRLVLALLRQPLWLLGTAFGGVGAVLQTVAVAAGALLVVQPLLVTGLLLALPLSVVVEHRRPAPAEWAWAGTVVLGLALFLTAARAGSGTDSADPSLLRVSALAAAGLVVLAAGLSQAGSGRYRALLLGLGGGASLGLAGGLLKAVTGSVQDGDLLSALSWPLLALVFAGGAGVVLNQSGYRVGVLTASQPAITIAEPVVGAGIGVAAFGERLSTDGVSMALQVVGVLLMVAGVIALARLTADEDPAGPASGAATGPTAGPDTTTPPVSAVTGARPTDSDADRAIGRPPEEELC